MMVLVLLAVGCRRHTNGSPVCLQPPPWDGWGRAGTCAKTHTALASPRSKFLTTTTCERNNCSSARPIWGGRSQRVSVLHVGKNATHTCTRTPGETRPRARAHARTRERERETHTLRRDANVTCCSRHACASRQQRRLL